VNQQLMVEKMRKFGCLMALLTAAILAGCGGNSSSSFAPAASKSSSGTTASNVATVNVTSAAASIPADNSASATIAAQVLDANNAAVAGVAVTFAASAGSLVVTQATTDASGLAKATVSAGTAVAGTSIKVTATAGSVSASTSVTVTNTQQTLSALTSTPQIPSDSTKSATISALLRDANNNVVSGVSVSFRSTSGALTVTQATTDATGTAKATLSAGGDPSNRNITVTATAGSSSAQVVVAVVGTKLTLSGPTSLVQGSAGAYTVSLSDAGGNGITGQTVTLTSSAGNTLNPGTVVTDSTGQKGFSLTAVNSGTDTLTATALGMQAQQAVSVSNQSFSFSAPAANATVPLGTPATVTVKWSASGAPQVGKTVTFSATRGVLSAGSAVTDASGNATVTISSTTAGPAAISATGAGVSALINVAFVATTANSITIQPSPATIAPQGQSTITATVRDAQNNLVQGQTVNFTITQDATNGSLSVGSAITNAQGQASTVYTASSTTSAKNGVVVSATVQGTAVSNSASLTVGGQAIFLSLGTGNTITTGPITNTQYQLPYSVQAIDAGGNGVNNVSITFTVTSLGYLKGGRSWNAGMTTWVTTSTTLAGDAYVYTLAGINGCRTEDVNNNGILDAGEDYNNNGKLDPGLVAATDVGSATTGSGGTAAVNIIYPKDHSYYVAVRLTATATVNGTQSSTSADFWLPGLAADFNTQTTSPPGPTSPYGQATTCGNPN
jgi:hypothetical protein